MYSVVQRELEDCIMNKMVFVRGTQSLAALISALTEAVISWKIKRQQENYALN